jgi:hypothetical protein
MRRVAEEEELGHPVQYLLIDYRYCYLEFAVVIPRRLSAADRTCLGNCGLPGRGTTRIVPFGPEKASQGILDACPNGSRYHLGSFPVCVGAFALPATQVPLQQQREEYYLSRCVEG